MKDNLDPSAFVGAAVNAVVVAGICLILAVVIGRPVQKDFGFEDSGIPTTVTMRSPQPGKR